MPVDSAARFPLQLRVCVVGTPRSGTTWLKRLLASAYEIEDAAYHTPLEVPWERLPAECILSVHWPPTEMFVEGLRSHGFATIVAARHPLDVLISILLFATSGGNTARWLEGEGGEERSIVGVAPTSAAFAAYTASPRARALLGVTQQWWTRSRLQTRYEELVGDPERELTRLTKALGAAPRISLPDVLAANELNALRSQFAATQFHFRRGQPRQWRTLLLEEHARAVAAPHAELLALLGYSCDPDPRLTDQAAGVNWLRLATESARLTADSRRAVLETAAVDLHAAARRVHRLESLLAAADHRRRSVARRGTRAARHALARAALSAIIRISRRLRSRP